MTLKITEITRRDILDALNAEGFSMYGRLEETEFLSRIWDLEAMVSTDSRFKNALADIWQHTINNSDWEPDWVVSDGRFGVLDGDDETFLRLLCESVHPVVRSDSTESERLVQLYNNYLQNDGYKIVESSRMSGKPIYVGRFLGIAIAPGIESVKQAFSGIDAGHIAQQITRMETAVVNDPELAIGTAKELLESCCKTILQNYHIEFSASESIPHLVKKTIKCLSLTPSDIPVEVKASDTIKRLLSNLASITQGVAELRNHYGTGHGKPSSEKGLQPRHAKLAVGAASTLVVFLIETESERS